MSLRFFQRYAKATACAALLILPVQPAAATQRLTAQPHNSLVRHSWMRPGSGRRALLYVGLFGAGAVNVYDAADLSLQGQIVDGIVNVSGGLAVDSQSRLYVAANSTVVNVYRRDALTPTGLYRFPYQVGAPQGIAVGPDGTFYAPLIGAKVAVVYPKGDRNKPALTLAMPGQDTAWATAVDAQNNLYVEHGLETSFPQATTIERCAPGSAQCTETGIALSAASGNLAFDAAGNLVACDNQKAQIEIFPPGTTQPARAISSGLAGCFWFALNRSENRLFVANQAFTGGAPTISVFDYASGKLLTTVQNGIPSTDSVEGVAVSPPAQPAARIEK